VSDKKITELNNITSANLSDVDEFVVVDISGDETKAITYGELKQFNGAISSDGLTVNGDITATGGDLNLDTLDLNAIAATKTVTATDVFVYDTSKDSDGGAWRKRTQGTSWYNETLDTATRGSRKEFPAVAVIVAEADTVTIYDGDDPSLPMWMVANRFSGSGYSWIGFNTTSTATAVSMLNGVLCVGSTDSASNFRPGLAVIDFGADSAVLILEPADPKDLKTISERNVGANLAKLNDVRRLVNSYVRDVAMTVLPDAPIDPATGLQVPTIAVATDGGTSIIQDDSTVDSIVDRGGYTIRSVAFDQDNRLYLTHGSDSSTNSTVFRLNDVKNASSYSIDSGWTQGDVAYGFTQFSSSAAKSSISLGAVGSTDLNQFYERIVGVADGFVVNSVVTPFLSRVLADYSDPLQDAVNYTTSTYNTGWMNGDIKGAFLSDTDGTDLVATDTISDRSVNDLTLTLGDGCTVAAVATGADLVGYTFASAEAVTLGTDISSTGALVWWEEVSGVWHLYVNDLSGGTDYDNGFAGTVGTGLTISGTTFTFAASKKMALARATATIPTAEQIAKIYNDEKVLFQENAQATLYGSSDAVTALAHDDTTNLLHVGTSAGRSVFQGLRRVSNTTTAVGTAISASNGLVVEE